MPLPRHIPTAIIGAGQAGLTMSHYLGRAGREHLVLDRRAALGGSWQDRWDSFRLVTPNWTSALAGQPYEGDDPDGFMQRDEIAARVASYATRIGAPVVLETAVERLVPRTEGGFSLETNRGGLTADAVVVATGAFHVPRLPAFAGGLPADICQLHAHDYHHPGSLPPGGVLIVGTGQTGAQLADELAAAGRRVFLSVGSNGWAPRRYRGRDIFWWLWRMTADGERYGVPMPTAETLPDPRMRLAGTPLLSGHHGGQDVNLRRMAAEGQVTLLGHVHGADGARLRLEPGLSDRLARSERFFDERLRPPIEAFVTRAGISAPPDDRVPFAYEPAELAELDLLDEGISSVVWATGYRMDYSWISAPVTDELGFPRQRRGVSSNVPGLYFIGALWQHTQASATLFGPSLDGPYLAEQMGIH